MNNTVSRVIGVSDYDFFALREFIIFFNLKSYLVSSEWVKKNQKSKFKTYLIDHNGFFPTGIIYRVKDFLEKKSYVVDVLDNRVIPEIQKINLPQLCSEPTAYIDQTNCTKALIDNPTGMAQVPTGVGKTRIIKDVIQQMKMKSVIITPSTVLKEQTAEYLSSCFGSNNVCIYDKRRDNKPIVVINYHSFGNTDAREWEDYHNILYDEAHHSTSETNRDFNLSHLNSFYYRKGLTATNFTRDDYSAILLETFLSTTVYSLSILESIRKKYIVPMVPIFFDISNDHLDDSGDYFEDKSKYIDNNHKRNDIIIDTINKMTAKKIPVLALVKHIEHGKTLSSQLNNSIFLNGKDECAVYNQNMVKKFNNLELDSIVGTSVIGEGIDTKACGAVINSKGGLSKRELLQNIGRTLRNFTYPSGNKQVGFYFDFLDRGQKTLYNHSKQRMKIIKQEFGVDPKIIKIN
jgi:superfamily II DNA or RNA helicase